MQVQKNKSKEINWYLCTHGHSYIDQNGQDKETFEMFTKGRMYEYKAKKYKYNTV